MALEIVNNKTLLVTQVRNVSRTIHDLTKSSLLRKEATLIQDFEKFLTAQKTGATLSIT